MKEPWKDDLELWLPFCAEKCWNPKDESIHNLFKETRSSKEEFLWFRSGYMRGYMKGRYSK